MWPLNGPVPSSWLVLYLVTWALHFVFVGYVLVGSAYALVQSLRRRDDDPIAARARDVLPFMLGCGITAGVAPLLFLQLLYQSRFYTANLLLGPRWGAVVPALIVGFYALYTAKAATTVRFRRLALATATACFVFVAWSWSELHLVMADDPAWRAMYAAGARFYPQGTVLPKLVLWLGVMLVAFAAVAAWWAPAALRRRLAAVAIAGHVIAGAAAGLVAVRGGSIPAAAHPWLYLLAVAVAVELVGWGLVVVAPDGAGVTVATGAATAALLVGTVVRESPRLAQLVPPRPEAASAGGAWAFALVGALAIVLIAWVVQTIRTAAPDTK